MAVDDESVSQFMAFTACQDTNTASHYLEMSGGSVEMAVGLFMEHGGSSGTPSSSNNNNDMSNNASLNNYMEGEEVRAPDPTRRDRLVDSGNVGHDNFSASSLLHQAIHSQNSSFRPSAFAFADPMDVDGDGTIDDVRERINQAAASSDRESNSNNEEKPSHVPVKLSDMFAPPNHILHRAGGFQGARNRAKDERKWLLVNLQADSDFACHALNRDVWRNDLVEALITSSFIFWQAMNDTGDGSTYIQRYSVNAFPHVAIIDPRTGRSMWKKEGWTQVDPITSEQFAQIAADFCSQHSFDKPPTAHKIGVRPNRPIKRPVESLTEQEQLEKAIRESQGLDMDMDDESDDDIDSLADTDNYPNGYDSDIEVVPPPAVKLKSESSTPATALTSNTTSTSVPSSTQNLPPKEKTFTERLLELEVGEEPPENGAVVQIRMPDGKKLVRKFNKNDPVKFIYAFVAQSNEEAKEGKEFELKAGYPPKDLIPKVEESIQDCNLSGESISVRWS